MQSAHLWVTPHYLLTADPWSSQCCQSSFQRKASMGSISFLVLLCENRKSEGILPDIISTPLMMNEQSAGPAENLGCFSECHSYGIVMRQRQRP